MGPVSIALRPIRKGHDLKNPELGQVAIRTLTDTLQLPSMVDFDIASKHHISLQIAIRDIDAGDFLIRSSCLFSLLGFGNARLGLDVELNDTATGRSIATFTHSAKHNGLSRGANDYLRDNSDDLIRELSHNAAIKIKTLAYKHSSQYFSLITKHSLEH
ncbi:MAG: hypothetical protein AAF351_09920 [Pseudomonadota bacterium]